VNERQHHIVTVGFPASGKTTFLAALWHLVCKSDVDTRLKFAGLRTGNKAHLNEIADRWRDGRVQERTVLRGDRIVAINLVDTTGIEVQVEFPDIAGEAFGQMWEKRDCDPAVAEMLRNGNVLLFVHPDAIKPLVRVVDVAEMATDCGIKDGNDQSAIPWNPELAPTQVQVVSLLSMLREPVLDEYHSSRRLAVMLSAWDKVQEQKLTPEQYLEQYLPLLHQYLRQAADVWEWQVYGVSAQGCPYDKSDVKERSKAALAILEQEPSHRIQLVHAGRTSHDLTEPLEWLID
jgi:hypothetical protein